MSSHFLKKEVGEITSNAGIKRSNDQSFFESTAKNMFQETDKKDII